MHLQDVQEATELFIRGPMSERLVKAASGSRGISRDLQTRAKASVMTCPFSFLVKPA